MKEEMRIKIGGKTQSVYSFDKGEMIGGLIDKFIGKGKAHWIEVDMIRRKVKIMKGVKE